MGEFACLPGGLSLVSGHPLPSFCLPAIPTQKSPEVKPIRHLALFACFAGVVGGTEASVSWWWMKVTGS